MSSPDGGGVWAEYGLDQRPDNASCVAPPRPVQGSGVGLQRAFAGVEFSFPIALAHPPGPADRIFVAQRFGTVISFPNRSTATRDEVVIAIDISTRIDSRGEGGLLGMALHPQWPSRLELFLSYTEPASGSSVLRSVIARYRSTDGGGTFSAATEERILVLDQPYDNHNGGNIAFGPDGYLYIGFGDGGSGGDPQNYAQRTNTLLGKFVRIDVDVPAADRYAIPDTNPFAASGAACNRTSSAKESATVSRCAEIFALGFRNPWRWSFDLDTGALWVADVGESSWEEINRVVLGGNYGWRVREGQHCYETPCSTAGLIDPALEYGHTLGVSVTGGYVYRGAALPGLVGKFLFADYSSGRLWAVTNDASSGASQPLLLLETDLSIASFGQTRDGEVYALDLSQSRLYKVSPAQPEPAPSFPQRLSATGCFQADNPRQPASGLIPYAVNAELWSDGASKERYLAIPDGATIAVGGDGDLSLPPGSVLAKTFFLQGRRIETRLFMHHLDGVWAGYSYEWSDDEADATLLPAEKVKDVNGQRWQFPSRAQCLTCHTAAAGKTLGLEIAQLNRALLYPTGRQANQLATLDHVGLFASPLTGSPDQLPRLPEPYGTGSLGPRARSYLHANCAGCHRQGAGQGPADLRYALSFAATNTCDVLPQNGSLGITDARLVAPGSPERSILFVRMRALDAHRMPPLATGRVDETGAALIADWIRALSGCAP